MFRAPAATADAQPSLFTSSVSNPAPAPARFASPQAANTSNPEPTGEQQAIVDAYWAGQHLTVEALAGTGKTTTLRLIAAQRLRRPGAYLAYNTSVAKDAEGRFPGRVLTGTAHSFAFRAVGHRYAHRLPNPRSRGRTGQQAQRLPAAQVASLLGLDEVRLGERTLSAVALARLAEATVGEFCKTADPQISPAHMPHALGVHTPGQVGALAEVVIPAAHAMWADLCNPDGRLWFSHSHYLKMWQLSHPRLPVDYVMFDEAQDANPCIAAIVAAQTHAQLIYVGDRNQSIMGWNGAVDAMASFHADMRLPLTRSFRFGRAIAAEANRWLTMLGSPLRVSGHDPIISTIGPLSAPQAILARTNGGAFGAVMAAQANGRKVALVGDGVEVRRFSFAARSLMAGRGCDMPELAAFKTWRQLVEYVDEEESGRDLAVLVKLVQRYGPGTLIDACDELVPARRAGVIVSTAHKAKGMEWPTVRIADDFAAPADGDPPEAAELMLSYVAVTRAKTGLDRGSLAWPDAGYLDDGRWFSYPTYTREDLL